MKVICSKEHLMEGINIVQKAISSKSALSILDGILIEATDKFKLTGNDLEIGIECFVEADIKESGSIVINSKMFGDIVRRLDESEVLIELLANNTVVIDCENSHFEVKGIAADSYPALPSVEVEEKFVVDQKTIRDMIRQTLFAVSLDDKRPILTGSLLECRENDITIVSIDGFRLALRKSEIDNKGENKNFNVVIPGKTLSEIVKILQPVSDEIYIYTTQNQILFEIANCKVVSRLLEGEYLNYNSIIPKEHETKCRVNTKELLSSLERASLITSEEKKYPVKFKVLEDKIIISSNTEIGKSREEVNVDTIGEKLDIGFNPRYFIESLKAVEEEEIYIYFTSNIGPCTIRPVEKDDFAYMILPVRVKNE